MARVMWHSSPPWDGTGYGGLTAAVARHLAAAGHEVAVSATRGTAVTTMWEGIPVLPPAPTGDLHGLLPHHARAWNADIVVALGDTWKYPARMIPGCPLLCWAPVDTTPMDPAEVVFFTQTPARPVAMSGHGHTMMAKAGIDAPLIPAGVDLELFHPLPMAERQEVRAGLGIAPGAFAVGMVSSPVDGARKAIGEQLAAFAAFAATPAGRRAVLVWHGLPAWPESAGVDVPAIAAAYGIAEKLILPAPYEVLAGQVPPEFVARLWAAMDVGLNATRGEGFGLAALEAQACGTPVILARNSTGPELAGPGWCVDTQRYWCQAHGADWATPLHASLVAALRQASGGASTRRMVARRFAEQWPAAGMGEAWDKLIAETLAGP